MCQKHRKFKDNTYCNSAAGRTGLKGVMCLVLQSEFIHKKTPEELEKILQMIEKL